MLSDLTKKEMQEFVKNLGLPAFRGQQLFDGIYAGKSLSEITVLPKVLPKEIIDNYPKYKIERKFTSRDGTIKYVFSFEDGNIVEGVLMKYKHGNTLCLSTQVGCRMGCKFCASTLKGLIRNLSSGEMLGQVLLVNRDIGGDAKNRKITNLVLMGSGEPLDNYDEVTKFLSLVSSEDGINISQRNISLSTCGLVPKIYALADDGFSVTLTISLHASNDEVRKKSMPIANVHSISEIIEACKYYFNKTGRRIVFEYTLIKNVNNSLQCAKELGLLLRGFSCHVNIIPLNEVKERTLKSTSREECYAFKDALEKERISATVRRTLGEDIGGACGQLRNQILRGEV
jgi:23S rRNA (adenine2503-C2)-methyltransferase